MDFFPRHKSETFLFETVVYRRVQSRRGFSRKIVRNAYVSMGDKTGVFKMRDDIGCVPVWFVYGTVCVRLHDLEMPSKPQTNNADNAVNRSGRRTLPVKFKNFWKLEFALLTGSIVGTDVSLVVDGADDNYSINDALGGAVMLRWFPTLGWYHEKKGTDDRGNI